MTTVVFSENEETLRQYRMQAAALLNGVLDEEILPQQAVNRWPCPRGVDASVDLAMQALLHFESDENEQQADPYYLDAQLQWLEDIRRVLAQGLPLSAHMLATYHSELATSYFDERLTLWTPCKSVFKTGLQAWNDARDALRVWLGR